jgi:FKBP-type peptidyl-prolyl cis-trans isomerase (trigger factor)
MKTEVKKIEDNKRELNVEVSGDIVKNKFEDVFSKITKEAKVPGFRPGHAPRDMIEKQYGSHAHEQVLKELVPDVYNQAIDQEKLDVIEMPEISEVKLDRTSLSFKAKVEVAPEIKLKNYKGIKIEYKKPAVSSDDVKRSIDSIKESRKAENIDDSFAKGLGYPSLKELEGAIERQLFLNKENQEHQRIENDLIEALLKDLDFKVPQTLIDRQLQDLVRQAKVDLAMKGMPREKIEEQDDTLNKELKGQAEKQVRVYLVLSEVAKKENIALDDHMPRKVMEFLMREAEWKEAV